MYDPTFKKTPYPPFDTLLPILEKKKLQKEKKSNPMKEYYLPSPVYTPSYEEDALTLVHNLVSKAAPLTKEDKREDTKTDKGETLKETKEKI